MRALEESSFGPGGRDLLRTALGLLDLTGAFDVMAGLDAYVLNHENLRLDLRTCWLLSSDTAGATFAALIGDDVRRLVADDRLPELAHGRLYHRARHVLEDSGTVPWAEKYDVLRAAASVVQLHPAVFRGLLAGCHAVYGDLQPAEALAHAGVPAPSPGYRRLDATAGGAEPGSQESL